MGLVGPVSVYCGWVGWKPVLRRLSLCGGAWGLSGRRRLGVAVVVEGGVGRYQALPLYLMEGADAPPPTSSHGEADTLLPHLAERLTPSRLISRRGLLPSH